jgi:DNA-binding NtrC family response regulator
MRALMRQIETTHVPSGRGGGEFERELACAARFDTGVLITGVDESEDRAVAEAIHRRSRRAIGPFVTINCTRRPEYVVESAVFGRACDNADGATRGCLELAHGGTIFLANVDAASARLQGLLLQFLESGEIRRVGQDCVHRKVDVRMIASVGSGLPVDRAHVSLREELFYRLNTLHLVVPMHRLDDSLYKQWLNVTRLQTVCA